MNIFILITCNISKGPDRLLADVLVGGCDQANKGRNGPAWHDSGRLLGRPGGNVSQSPGCFELDWRTVHISQEGDELGDETSADQLVNGRMFVTRQQLPVFKTVHKSYCASSYVAFIYGKKKRKKDDFFNAQSLPCSLCSLELGLRIPTVHSCDNLLDRPLPEPLHRTKESSLLDMQI